MPPEENIMELYFMEVTETDFKLAKKKRELSKSNREPGS